MPPHPNNKNKEEEERFSLPDLSASPQIKSSWKRKLLVDGESDGGADERILVDEVHCSVDGVDDPGGAVGEGVHQAGRAGRYVLLANEAVVREGLKQHEIKLTWGILN